MSRGISFSYVISFCHCEGLNAPKKSLMPLAPEKNEIASSASPLARLPRNDVIKLSNFYQNSHCSKQKHCYAYVTVHVKKMPHSTLKDHRVLQVCVHE